MNKRRIMIARHMATYRRLKDAGGSMNMPGGTDAMSAMGGASAGGGGGMSGMMGSMVQTGTAIDQTSWQLNNQVGSALIDDVWKPKQYGDQSTGAIIGKSALSSAAAGAKMGSSIPIVGTGIGAGIGLIYGAASGWIKSGKIHAAAHNAMKQHAIDVQQQDTQRSQAELGADPNLATGRVGAQYMKAGGVIKLKHYKDSGGLLDTSNISGTTNSSSIPVTYGKDDPSVYNTRTPLNDMITSGGTAKKLSSDNALIVGNSHEQGGVDIPELNTEVEGGETTLNNFVFSKKLGFADQHKPIARAKGIIEKKPKTPERATSLRLLMDKETKLAQQQESLKAQLGIQND